MHIRYPDETAWVAAAQRSAPCPDDERNRFSGESLGWYSLNQPTHEQFPFFYAFFFTAALTRARVTQSIQSNGATSFHYSFLTSDTVNYVATLSSIIPLSTI